MGRREHTNELFCNLKLSKFTDLIDLKVAVIMFKANMKILPVNVQQKFISNTDHRYCLRNTNRFKVQHARTTLKSNCISIYGVKLFNCLPKSIVEAKNVFCFKKYV